jgi:hypothetical protein
MSEFVSQAVLDRAISERRDALARAERAERLLSEAAHKASGIGFTYGALGRDFTYVYKNVEDMLAELKAGVK